ncbi:hypothetical protein [Cellulomonas sp. B6]|jgi:hypothetical protein|uniref:hypothetical protein n=1 Tax=Cellulomonas sp. B6 TaxID=1295626 RepID=UPI00073CD65D|nr:hypothetical protein [Cellulomonas sp. B6]KSW15044.1 hypothetical protein ATM99_02365 [Cellulomonas sp. B6]
MPSRVEHPLHDLRLERRALRAERELVAWWRRVVRARIDLLVAQAAAPGPLGEQVAFALPLEVCLQVPRPDDLRDALSPGSAAADVGALPRLRALDARLARYETGVQDALADATSRLVAHVAADPTASLRRRTPAVEGS